MRMAIVAAPMPGALRSRPGPQDFFCINRQQSDRTAEQHGEQVQRDGTEHQLVTPDVMESGENGFEGKAFTWTRRGLQLDTKGSERGNCTGQKRGGVNGHGAAEEGVEKSAHGRAEDRGEL